MSYYFSYQAASLYQTISQQLTPSTLAAYEKTTGIYPAHKLHATLLFVPEDYQPQLEGVFAKDLTAPITAIEVWPDLDNVGKPAAEHRHYLVATLDNPTLVALHKHLQSEVNYIDPLPQFKPHISLQKSPSLSDLLDPASLMFLIGQTVVLDRFQCRNVIEKTVATNKEEKTVAQASATAPNSFTEETTQPAESTRPQRKF